MDPEALLGSGTLLRGRWRILRFVGQGGMGVVYEASDIVTGERVALKVLPGHAADDAVALASLRDELLVARRVSHHNVCRVHEIYLERSPGTREPAFFTMEFLEGKTLAGRLKYGGRLEEKEALPLIRQLAAGLQSAHDVGVVHRDLKPGNVMLVEEGGATRAVVTDFGIAWAVTLPRQDLRAAAPIAGSPAYMAPEQLEGGPVSPATDVYALGVLMCELVTGKLPVEGSMPHAPTLSNRWNRTIRACLRSEPARRPASAGEVVKMLDPVKRSTRLWWLPILALALGAAAQWTVRRLDRGGSETHRAVVAVLGFRNSVGRPEEAWISTGLSEMLVAELGEGERVRIVPGDQVVRVKSALGISDAEWLDPPSLKRLTDALGTDVVLLGSYFAPTRDSVRVDLRLQDSRTGLILGAFSVTGNETALDQLVAELGRRSREVLRVQVRPRPVGPPPGSATVAGQATRWYSEALERHRGFDEDAARRLLQRALELEPGFVDARALLAEVLEGLGEDDRARAEADRAVLDSAELPPGAQRRLEAFRARLRGDSARAASEYASFLAAHPDDIETGLLLAAVQPRADALRTVEALRRIPGPPGADPRIDLAEVRAYLDSDAEGALRVLARSETRLVATAQPLLVAQARVYRGDALTTLGRLQEAEPVLLESERLVAGAGNAGWAAELKRMRSDVVALSGRWDEAQRLRAEVLETYLKLSAPAKAARAAEDLVQSALVRGEIAEAHRWFDRAVQLLSSAGIDPARLGARESNLAMAEADMVRRRKALERWIDWSARQGNPPPPNSRQYLAWALYDEDRLGDALATVEALLGERPKGFAAISLVDLKASILLEQGHATEAVRLLRSAFDTPAVGQSPMLQLRKGDILGRALGDDGALDAALETVRSALPLARPPQPVNYSLRLRLREVDLLRRKGEIVRAQRQMADLWAAVPADYTLLRMEARLVRGRLDLAAGHAARARADLQGLSEEASRRGLHRMARQARLAAAWGLPRAREKAGSATLELTAPRR